MQIDPSDLYQTHPDYIKQMQVINALPGTTLVTYSAGGVGRHTIGIISRRHLSPVGHTPAQDSTINIRKQLMCCWGGTDIWVQTETFPDEVKS